MGCSPSKTSKFRDPAPVIKSKSRTYTNPMSVIEEETENEELEAELLAMLLETSSSSSVSDLHVLTDEDDDDVSSFEFVDEDNNISRKEDTTTSINAKKDEGKNQTENEKGKESPKHVAHTEEGIEKSKAEEKKPNVTQKQVRFTLPNEKLNIQGPVTYADMSSSIGDDQNIKLTTVPQLKRRAYTAEEPSGFIANYPEGLHERQINWYNSNCIFDMDKDFQNHDLNRILYMFRDDNAESSCYIM